ncbi:MAG: cupin domain-containing protein [Magnetospirillum sp.]
MRFAVILASSLLAATTALAADAYPTKPVLKTSKTVVDETIVYPTTGPAQVKADIVTIAPGADTVFHRHGVPMFAYILKGTVVVDYGDKGKKTFTAGQGMVEAMNTTHRGTNPGTEPVEILAVYMGAEGAENVIPMK